VNSGRNPLEFWFGTLHRHCSELSRFLFQCRNSGEPTLSLLVSLSLQLRPAKSLPVPAEFSLIPPPSSEMENNLPESYRRQFPGCPRERESRETEVTLFVPQRPSLHWNSVNTTLPTNLALDWPPLGTTLLSILTTQQFA
jgi:hypothetical protein